MAIRAVSSVNFNNYNNISFEGRRNKKHAEHQRHSTNPLKVVPLAALIAMSPLTSTYANEPYTNKPAYVQGLDASQQYEKVPLPSHFSFINKFIVDMPNGDKLGLYFIDTNQNKDNYEMFEYIHVNSKGDAIARGILKQIKFYNDNTYGKSVVLNGIGLSKTDEKNYAPVAPFKDHIKSDDVYDFFYRIINESSNNGSISTLSQGTTYTSGNTYINDLQKYKRAIGIIK